MKCSKKCDRFDKNEFEEEKQILFCWLFIQEYSSFYSKITDFSMILVFLGVSSFWSVLWFFWFFLFIFEKNHKYSIQLIWYRFLWVTKNISSLSIVKSSWNNLLSIENKKSHLFILKTMNFEEETSLLKNLKRLQDKLTNNKCSLPIETYNNLIHSSKHVYFLLFPLFTHSSIEWLRYSRILQ